MKKILLLTSVFMIALVVGVSLKHREEFEFAEMENEEFEHHQDGPSEFLKYHEGIRTRSDESKPGYPNNHLLTELQKAVQFAALKNQKSSATIQSGGNGVIAFTERGPGNIPGRTRGIIVDPDDSSHKTWFLGSASGGVWKTTDAGATWQWLTPTVPNMATSCLAMAESNHNVIYAGTGEGFGLVDGVNGMGIFKSMDRGATWTVLANSAELENVNRIVIDPAHEDIVIAACNKGIYKSTDGGATWNKVYSGVVQDLKATPGNFSVIYGGQYGFGTIKSTTSGDTWFSSNAGMSPDGRVEIAVSPVKTDRICASVDGSLSGGNSDLYVSDDGGVTWYLVTLTLTSKTVDYLSSQGWYDNTVAFSPYSKDVVYVGGIGAFQITLGAPAAGSNGSYSMNEINTTSFISLVNFGASAYGGKLETGSSVTHDTVEVRFGAGLKQRAHRFLVPDGATAGVPDTDYTYQDYVNVPFQVWNKSTNQQLMVSFRDQDRNSVFDLITQNTTDADATKQSREYLFIHNVPYSATPNASIKLAAGQKYNEMYFFWPVLANGGTWDSTALPVSKLQIKYSSLNNFTSTVKTVSDSYNTYDGINNANFVHPDQHNIVPIKVSDASSSFQLLMANDGGIYLSKASTSPGTSSGDWKKVGYGYNTSQFYGADKKPGAQEYFGGMQDNATWFTPGGTVASASTYYTTNARLGGDGFEALWHSSDSKKMIGGAQFNYFSKSSDGGITWSSGFSGLTLNSNNIPDTKLFPFISKLANSKQAPDRIYTVGSEGVWYSTNFGTNWTLTPITSNWGLTSFIDVEVSRANANIVWAGAGQYSGSDLFVSTNAGLSFTDLPNPPGMKLGNISRIATHPWEPNTAYALYSFAQTAKILKTTDLGVTWNDISGFGSGTSSTNGFPDVAVYCLYVRTDDPNIIWVGTEIGIVESLDGGSTWALLNTFPNVAVWDMKGQDNEVVIATHGRGIWTATLEADQNAITRIAAAGTTPQSKYKIMLQVPVAHDSVVIKINTTGHLTFLPPGPGSYILQISNVPIGPVTIQTVSYKSGTSYPSAITNDYNFKLTAYRQSYSDYFVNTSSFYLNGFSLQGFGDSNSSLQTDHSYANNKNSTATLLVPIIVSAGSNTSLGYDDVAIVQPGSSGSVFGQKVFNDYVVAEATTDGITWTPIGNGYNASAQADWLAAYNAIANGDQSMTVAENFNLKTNFSAGDTLIVRFRLFTNGDAHVAWGWSIDNLYIQQLPTAVEANSEATAVYPNPSSGKFKIVYSLTKDSDVTINVWDITGRNVLVQDKGLQQAGKNETELNLESMTEGIYLARLKTIDGEHVFKLMVKK